MELLLSPNRCVFIFSRLLSKGLKMVYTPIVPITCSECHWLNYSFEYEQSREATAVASKKLQVPV